VGSGKSLDGVSYLYVFDPSSRDPESITKHSKEGLGRFGSKADSLIEPYKRGEAYFSRYSEFEILLYVQGNLPAADSATFH
jgi:hypothetical protein